MPSARELLEQADALMRKNRSHGDNDIPLLTDAVAIATAPAPASAPSPPAATIPAMAETTPVEEPSPSPPAATIPAMAATVPVEELPPGLPAATTHLTTESESAAGDQERWRALAEQVSMQVLQ